MTTLAEISAEGWVLIITAVSASVVVPLINLIITLKSNKQTKVERDEAKEDRAVVKETLAVNTNKNEQAIAAIAEVGEKTHTLVNSQNEAQLTLYAIAARRLAELTKDAKDIQAADLAEKLLCEHRAKQQKVDEAERDQ